ncbi:MAG: AgmX/PglI C-terminal domain-containing protein [Myxococcaceae bacterium]|nr:AgmX/PglI C-terminal domain-containing protein [Myxococcaceae bacterium]
MRILVTVCLLFAAPLALAQAQGATTADGGTDAGLDVKKLPFTPDSIKQVIAYHQPKIQACYEEMLATQKKPQEGRLMTTFVITPEGLVKNAKVAKKGTTLRNRKLHDCVVAVLSGMEFPKPPDGRTQPVEYPFNLKAIK